MEKRKLDVERGSWSVAEFKSRHNLSNPAWRRMVATGRAPKMMLLGGKLTRISHLAEEQWLLERETMTLEIKQEVDAQRSQARDAISKAHQTLKAKRNNKKAAGV